MSICTYKKDKDRHRPIRRGRAAKGQCLNMPEFCLILDWQKSRYLNYYNRELITNVFHHRAATTTEWPPHPP
ncbi:hypothetical protein VN97_g7980 [Penicillium thymicola]|uniref:Uncharacterized protein n=1 Tax=Penicillium thymicola TaxID=293382 RepID=A0AAI9TDR9_PENTH|nr:hypothetical protein VN97_g7980 [Penicillium thymicola]